MATALWKRIDRPGHDAAVLTEAGDELHLEGIAMFNGDTTVSYQVRQSHDGLLRARIEGRRGTARFTHDIRRTAAGWTLNDTPMGLAHLRHLTLGFTPATAALVLRRETLPIRDRIGIAAVHFDIARPTLTAWPQHFRRRDRDLYDYSTPDRATMLQIEGDGFIRDDPGHWHREA